METHPSNVAKMLSAPNETAGELVDRIAGVMAVNSLSAEAVLARFFSDSLMSAHLVDRLGKSGKGNPATLAARIVAQWKQGETEVKKRKSRGEQATETARAGHKEAQKKTRKNETDVQTSAPSAPASHVSLNPRTVSAHAEAPPHALARTSSVSAAPVGVGSRAGLTDLRSPRLPARLRHGAAKNVEKCFDVSDPRVDVTDDGGSWHLSRSQDDLLTANWRMRRVDAGRAGGAEAQDRRRFYMREPSFFLRTKHLGTLTQRPSAFYQLTRQGVMFKAERGGCPLCCGDEFFLLTLEERDEARDSAHEGNEMDAKNMMLSVPGDPARALPNHRLRMDNWTECHCDGQTRRNDEEVDIGYVMDGVGPMDAAAHLRAAGGSDIAFKK